MPKQITEEQCVEMGGHCWQMANYILTSDPPQSVRFCKHCGKRQNGRPQESFEWYDA